jgi:hypothetical protein
MGVLADIQAISSDSAQLATDQASLADLTTKVAAAQAAIAADQTASNGADGQLSTDLQASGPAFVLNADGSASVYEFASVPPGYTITVATPAS